MAVVTLEQSWQDIIVDAGQRPNIKLTFSNGVAAGIALNTKVFEGFFLWDAVAANATVNFFFAQLTATAAGLEDILRVEDARESLPGTRSGTQILLEVLRGESVPNGRFFKRTPSNVIQSIHPNNDIGGARPEMDETFGWDYPGFASPFENPTAASRLIIPENLRVELGMRNPNGFAVRNTSRIIFNTIEFLPLDPEKFEDRDRLVGIIKGRIPSVSWSPGLAQSDLKSWPEAFGVKQVKLKDGKVTFNNEVLG